MTDEFDRDDDDEFEGEGKPLEPVRDGTPWSVLLWGTPPPEREPMTEEGLDDLEIELYEEIPRLYLEAYQLTRPKPWGINPANN